MNESLNRLAEAQVRVYTVKTDAFTIDAKDIRKAKSVLDFGEERPSPRLLDQVMYAMDSYAKSIANGNTNAETPSRILAQMRGREMMATVGKWRVSKEDHTDIKLPCESMAQKEVHEIKIVEPTTEQIPLTLQEEYDVDKICEIFEEKRRVVVRAEFAGSGKSHACKHMQKRGHNVVFVCPTNKLCQAINEDEETKDIKAVTANHFFGVGLTEESRSARFDDAKYDVVVFDEIFLLDTRKLARIKKYAETHPEKIVLATGDTNQLEPVEPMTNTYHDTEAYTNQCVDLILPYQLYFRENKRLRTAEDKEKLRDFKRDIFDVGIPIATTVRRYFPVVDRSDTDFNIAYFNATCKRVADRTRKRIGTLSPYDVGESLVCRSYFKTKSTAEWRGRTFYKNYEYKITAVSGSTIQLDGEVSLPIDAVRRHFIHNYCRTCHSFQGLSVNTPITIYDWQCKWASRKWIYTAVTRARQLYQIQFIEYQEQDNTNKITAYMRQKVEGYKAQDRRAGRPVNNDSYVTAEWLSNCLGKPCQNCGDCLLANVCDGSVDCNLTAQRINNDIAHELDNVLPFCCSCNCALSNRT
jgi:hypothetical protein